MAQPQYIERLKSRKAEVTGHLDQLRAATRFELPTQTPIELKPLDELAPPPRPRPHPAGPSLSPEKKEEETYTERLLKAKKKAWEERERVSRSRAEGGMFFTRTGRVFVLFHVLPAAWHATQIGPPAMT